MIEFCNVSASYDGTIPILEDVSFTIEDGQFVAFVGTNGAGKSTTMRLMNGLLKPESGDVLIDGVLWDLASSSGKHQEIVVKLSARIDAHIASRNGAARCTPRPLR